MELRVLQYFLELIKEGSISAAAKSLHLTQPTLSRQLMQLEKQLGVILFDRGHKQIELTSEGLLLKRRAEEILSLVDMTEQQIVKESKDISGDIYLGGAESVAVGELAKVMAEFRRQYPNVRFHFHSAIATDVTDRLERGLLDIAVVVKPVDDEKFEALTLPSVDRMALLMRRDSPLSQLSRITADDLVGVDLIGPFRPVVREHLNRWAKRELSYVATYNLLTNAALMVRMGLGHVICYDGLYPQNDLSDLVVVPLYPEYSVGVVVMWKKNQRFSVATRTFIEFLYHAFKA